MIDSFVERARRRYLWNELLAQSAFTAALLLGGMVALLLAGTQLLDWRVVLLLCAAAAGVGLYRMRQKLPSLYGTAVLLDQKAALHDALSTALYFEHPQPGFAGLPAIREFQKQQAERLIPTVDLPKALPFQMPRAVYAAALLATAAVGLFALRYGVSRSLSLQPPVTQVVMEGFGLHAPEDKLASARKKTAGGANRPGELDEQGLPRTRAEEKRAGDPESAPASALSTVSDAQSDSEKTDSAAAGKDASAKGEGAGKEGGEKGSEQADAAKPAGGKPGEEAPGAGKEGPQQGEQGPGKEGSQQNASLLSKMKDAMKNLMDKAKPQSNTAAGQKPNGAQGQQKGQSQQAKAGEKGTPGESKDGGQQESAEGQQGQQAGDQDNSDNGQGKGNGKSSEQQAAAQPGSGIGKQDGAKNIKAAEQKAAMGKLSEVIGKRSANVSGEMMVESQSGPQQLRTQYSRRNATHGETGGEVNRDEIPVELQGYVRQYFEEVRKAERKGPEPHEAKVK